LANPTLHYQIKQGVANTKLFLHLLSWGRMTCNNCHSRISNLSKSHLLKTEHKSFWNLHLRLAQVGKSPTLPTFSNVRTSCAEA